MTLRVGLRLLRRRFRLCTLASPSGGEQRSFSAPPPSWRLSAQMHDKT